MSWRNVQLCHVKFRGLDVTAGGGGSSTDVEENLLQLASHIDNVNIITRVYTREMT